MADVKRLEEALRNADAAGDAQAATILAAELRKSMEPASVTAGNFLNTGFPRQLGLMARYTLEAPAEAAQLVTEPIRQLITDPVRRMFNKDAAPGATTGQMASSVADMIGLPSPATPNERTVGSATKTLLGSAGIAGLAGKAAQAIGPVSNYVASMPTRGTQFLADASNAAQKLPSFMAQNVPVQLTSAAGAGLAGGASREAGGSPIQQFGSAVAGGVAGGMVPGAMSSGINAARGALSSIAPQTNITIDARITPILQQAGIDYSQIPERVRQSLRADLSQALDTGTGLNADALRRLVDFRMTGLTPTRGAITQDPIQITREMNLAKTTANMKGNELHGLPLIQNANNARLIQNLDELGAARGDILQAGQTVTGSIMGRQASLRSAEEAAWEAAKSSPGYRMPVGSGVISDVNRALGDEALMPFMNPTISRYMEAFQTGAQPFTPQAYRNLQSMLSNEISKGGNEGAAARLARNILERADLNPGAPASGGSQLVTGRTAAGMRADNAANVATSEAVDAVNQARRATRAAYAYEDSNPLVRSVLSGGASSDPKRIAERFVIGGTPNEAAMLAREVGDAGRGPIRDAILLHLKEKAINGASNEIGKFSQSAFNKALNAIGDQKLGIFFTREEIAALRANGRVASYVQNQPIGSAVNNSNSGAFVYAKALDGMTKFLEALPGIGPLAVTPARNYVTGINANIQTGRAQNVAPSLLLQQKQPMAPGLLTPALVYGGGLLSP